MLPALSLALGLMLALPAPRVLAEGSPTANTPTPPPAPLRRVLDSSVELLKNTVVDGAGIIISPLKWRTREWLTFGAVGGATALLVLFADEPIRGRAQSSPGFQSFGDAIRPLGTGPGIAALTGGMFLSGVVLDREKDRETARLLVESLAVSYLIESSLKHAIGRARPGAELGSRDFEFFGGNKSMPSGEVTAAFAMAAVVTSQYDSLWVKLAAYGLAGAVGAGRIGADGHWSSDVLLGAVLGTAVAKSIVYRHRKREREKANQPHWEFGLTPSGARYTYIW